MNGAGDARELRKLRKKLAKIEVTGAAVRHGHGWWRPSARRAALSPSAPFDADDKEVVEDLVAAAMTMPCARWSRRAGEMAGLHGRIIYPAA